MNFGANNHVPQKQLVQTELVLDSAHERVITEIKNFIKKRFPLVFGIYLFGSFGSKYERAESDIDLAILAEGLPAPAKLWMVAQELACQLHRDIDLIDLQAASTIFRFQIIAEGTRIDTRDELYCDRFELQALSRYYHFSEARKELLANYWEDVLHG